MVMSQLCKEKQFIENKNQIELYPNFNQQCDY